MWRKTYDSISRIPKDERPLVVSLLKDRFSDWKVGTAKRYDDGKLEWVIDGKTYSAFEVEYWLDPSDTDVYSKYG